MFCYLLEACFLMRQKNSRSGWERVWGGDGRGEGGETVFRIYSMRKKNLFLIKGEEKENSV